MHELELARIIQADRDREMTIAVRWRRLRAHDDAAQPAVTEVSAAVAPAVRSGATSARASVGPSRS
jgi:hypothetical protein